MTMLIRNQNASNTDQLDATMHAVEAAWAALYYPSLEGSPWDDELLPSGD